MKQTKKAITKVVALFAALMLLASLAVIPANAAEGSLSKVNDATKGVFLIVYTYPPSPQPDAPDQLMIPYSVGSGFLINEDTVITAYHVLHDEEMHQQLRAVYGDNYLGKMQIRVYYKSGAFVKATEIQPMANSSYDFTAIKLAQPINGAQQLTLAEGVSDSSLTAATPVYALGYPYTSFFFEEAGESTFTPKDVDTKNGIVSKFSPFQGINHIKHSAATLSGMSGGPLLNDNGVVLGINRLNTDMTESENWAVNVANLIDSLNQLSINYTSTPYPWGPAPAPTNDETEPVSDTTPTETVVESVNTQKLEDLIKEIKGLDSKKYSNWDSISTVLGEAEALLDSDATQAKIDDAYTALKAAKDGLKEKTVPMGLIIGIVAGVIVLIAVIVIIIVVAKKNKGGDDFESEPAPMPGPYGGMPTPPPANGGFAPVAPAPAPGFTPTAPGGSAETGVLGSGSGETTVLSSGSNETTVLSGKPYAKLTRKSNNEIVQISANTFVIGKERRKVNFCIEDNGTISRSHAQIIKNGAKVSIVDLGSKNGTFVNGVKCAPQAAVDLKDGDKITLSDEDFIINMI
ncbi:MAG: trypsin-like peptidase domain-containing protein [Clostridia bacterium]|nr:trypsin-like peptidase domain-containing protein [Clostridia bacterium]